MNASTIRRGTPKVVLSVLQSNPQPQGEIPASLPPVLSMSSMADVWRKIDAVASSMINVLLLGETGVGKEVVARTLFQRSHRSERPYVVLNCASVPEQLIESEFFGYEAGAFSGATRAKPGLFETAEGGTVFLDEIGELPLQTQAKMLRVLEDRRATRLGALKSHPIDVRIIAATNRNLSKEIAEGRFRSDLFYRLEGMTIFIPPLRRRRDEISGLAETFMRAACEANRRPPMTLSAEAKALLREQPWKGNVRELKNVMERAVLLCRGQEILLPEHLRSLTAQSWDEDLERESPGRSPQAWSPALIEPKPLSRPTALPALGPGRRRLDLSREAIVSALGRSGGNQSRAATLLGISRGTLINRLKAFDLRRPK